MDNNNNLKDFLKKNGFSVAICSTVAILLVATLYFSYTGFQSSEPNNMVENDSNSFEAVNKSDVKSYKESTTQKETEKTTDKKQSEKVTESSTETTTNLKQSNEENKQDDLNEKSKEKSTNTEKESKSTEEAKVFSMFDESKEMTWPVSGQIVMDYSTETAIYDKTLELYRTNDSICISSPEGTDVMASSEGIVEDVFTDNENGKTIVINHGNGWTSTYSQLQEEVNVTVGQIVKEGEFIGKIGSPSNYSVLLGPHLNFKITKDEISSDPKLVLAQIEE